MDAPSPYQRLVTVPVLSKKDHKRVLHFKVSVLDTFPDDEMQERPTVVALHGFPGECSDFDELASKLHGMGIRFIAPSEIGVGEISMKKRHVSHVDFTTSGRLDHLKALLHVLHVTRIDLLIGHSAGAWPVYEAGASWDSIGSILLLSPAGAEPNRPMQPYWIHLFWTWLLTWTILWIFAIPIATFLVRQTGFKSISFSSRVIMAVLYTGNHNFENVPLQTMKIRERGIPTVVCYALNDKMVSQRISADIINYLGIPKDNDVTIPEESGSGNETDQLFVPQGWFCRCIKFERGGHNVHKSHKEEILAQIKDLLRRHWVPSQTAVVEPNLNN